MVYTHNRTSNVSTPRTAVEGSNDYGVVVIVCVVCVIVSLAVCVKFNRSSGAGTCKNDACATVAPSDVESVPSAPQSPVGGLPVPEEP